MGVGYNERTFFGGVLAMIAWAILLAEFWLTMDSIFWQRDHTFMKNEIFLSDEEMQNTEVNLGEFDFKFAFMLEVKETVEDLLNNPYIEIIAYQWNVAEGFLGYIGLESCSEEYANALIKPQVRFHYDHPICIKETDKLFLRSNYRTSSNERHIGYFMMYCLNTTENGNWCKSREEADNWLKDRDYSFIYEETRVN